MACRFTDKDVSAFSGQDKVPVLADGGQVVSDLWAIACDLERIHPDPPSPVWRAGGAVGGWWPADPLWSIVRKSGSGFPHDAPIHRGSIGLIPKVQIHFWDQSDALTAAPPYEL